MEKVLEGDLSRFEVPDLLTFLHLGHRSGVLVMERKEQETKLYLRDGTPVFAASSRDDLRLGPLLVRQGKMQAAEVEAVLERRAAPGLRVGQALVAAQLLTEAELASLLKVQVSEVIFETFGWGEGVFTFFDRIRPPATAITLEMDLQNLLMEGVRRIDVRGRLADTFPDLNMAVETLANPDRVKHAVNFTPDEWKVFFLLDGRRSLAEICRLADQADDQACLQILYNLMVAGFVAVVPPPPAPPVAAEPVVMKASPLPSNEGSPAPAVKAPSTISIEFGALARGRKASDDTKDIVTPNAVQYMANARKMTVSRLILVADGRETSFPLTGETYTLGRHRNNDIVISDPKVSSFHARIDRGPDGFSVVDLKSRNGTFLNGRRIETGLLKTGDEVRLGTARVVYKVDYSTAL
jgi:hypothetical protein